MPRILSDSTVVTELFMMVSGGGVAKTGVSVNS